MFWTHFKQRIFQNVFKVVRAFKKCCLKWVKKEFIRLFIKDNDKKKKHDIIWWIYYNTFLNIHYIHTQQSLYSLNIHVFSIVRAEDDVWIVFSEFVVWPVSHIRQWHIVSYRWLNARPSNSSALATGLLQSCAKPSISCVIIDRRVRYDAVLIYKRRTEIWKDADFDTLPRPGDAFSN